MHVMDEPYASGGAWHNRPANATQDVCAHVVDVSTAAMQPQVLLDLLWDIPVMTERWSQLRKLLPHMDITAVVSHQPALLLQVGRMKLLLEQGARPMLSNFRLPLEACIAQRLFQSACCI